MIQRIQSFYLIIVLVPLVILLTGPAIVTFSNAQTSILFDVFGLFSTSEKDNALKPILVFPFYLLDMALILMHAITLIKYKKLKSQLKWAQYGFLFYVIMAFALLTFVLVGGELVIAEPIISPHIGLFLFLAGIPFTFLAVQAIKKDKELVDSIDRIR